tara:strand:+ start:1549 stop:1698 length:150 start_codon:yes stop_codon:yes gene_type:complete
MKALLGFTLLRCNEVKGAKHQQLDGLGFSDDLRDSRSFGKDIVAHLTGD